MMMHSGHKEGVLSATKSTPNGNMQTPGFMSTPHHSVPPFQTETLHYPELEATSAAQINQQTAENYAHIFSAQPTNSNKQQ
jgi:hypothetical protein